VTWEVAKSFSHALAIHMATDSPDKYIAKMSKAARKGLIFVDYLRNQRDATAIAPYSTRARPGATVSVPIEWDELTPKLRSDQFTGPQPRAPAVAPESGSVGGVPAGSADDRREVVRVIQSGPRHLAVPESRSDPGPQISDSKPRARPSI
jgi:hypothetical protein